MEAPKTIFIDSNYSQTFAGMYSQGMNKDSDIEYIRKDIYDAHCRLDIDRADKAELTLKNNILARLAENDAKDIQLLQLGLNEAQACIKELEDILSFLQSVNHQQFTEAFPEVNKLAWRIKELEKFANKVGHLKQSTEL